jgi:hypothetical protein
LLAQCKPTINFSNISLYGIFLLSREDITDNIRQQPKFVVFLTQLLLLFKTCFFCRHESEPSLKVSQVGTMVTITASCQNPKCKKDFVWKSQQLVQGTKIYAGNFLLSFAILVAGSSASKVLQVMKHMGLACISLSTYFRHQRVSIIKNTEMHKYIS